MLDSQPEISLHSRKGNLEVAGLLNNWKVKSNHIGGKDYYIFTLRTIHMYIKDND